MKSTALKERIEFHLFETTRSTETLFVAGGHVAGGRFPFRFGFGAFENNDVAWHGLELWEGDTSLIFVFVKRNRVRIFIFVKNSSTTESDTTAGAEFFRSIFFFPLGLALNRETGERNGLEAWDGDALA